MSFPIEWFYEEGALDVPFLFVGSPLPAPTIDYAYTNRTDLEVVPSAPVGTGTFAVDSGTLPDGVTIDATDGSLDGIPTAPGLYTIVVSGVLP